MSNLETNADIHFTHVEEHANLDQDPFLPYSDLENVILHEMPTHQGLQMFADFISIAPYKRIKGTSNHGLDPQDSSHVVMLEYSAEKIVQKQAAKFADAIVRGEDLDGETAKYVGFSKNIISSTFGRNVDFDQVIHELALQDGYVIDNVRAVIPNFNNLSRIDTAEDTEKIKLTIVNLVLAEKMRITANELKSTEAKGKEIATPQVTAVEQDHFKQQPNMRFTIEIQQSLLEELKQPNIPVNRLKYFAALLERYALHIPMKVTLDGQQLGMGGIIHGMLEKISEGIYHGINLEQRSAEALALAEKDPYLLAIAETPANYKQIGSTDPRAMSSLKHILPNYLFLKKLQAELLKDHPPVPPSTDLRQGDFSELFPKGNEWELTL